MPISGSGIELLSHKQVVQGRKTDNNGLYDFGEIPSGKYRVHIDTHGFCAPKVVCKGGTCTIEPKLKLDSRDPVTVY